MMGLTLENPLEHETDMFQYYQVPDDIMRKRNDTYKESSHHRSELVSDLVAVN